MKISSKYEKEVDKLIKLIYDYWIKEKITKKDLDSSFSFTDEKKVEIIKEGFMQAIHEKNSDKIEYLTTSISTFKLFPKYSLDFVDIFSELSKEEFHEEHETIASYFQRLHLPQTIDCIYELAISNFEKYRWDDNFALVRKCCFALGDINTPKAKEKLELLLQSEEETIREHAMEQLKRCDFTNKDVE